MYNLVKTLLSNYAKGSTEEILKQRWCWVSLIQKNCGSLGFCVEKDPEVTSGLTVSEHGFKAFHWERCEGRKDFILVHVPGMCHLALKRQSVFSPFSII